VSSKERTSIRACFTDPVKKGDRKMSTATWFHKTVVVLASASVLTVGLPATWAADAPLPRASQALKVKPGNLNGKVLAADGVTAQEGVPVRLIDAHGQLVSEATTNMDGAYTLGNLQEGGDYTLIVGRGIKGKIIATDQAKVSSLTVKASNDLLNSETPSLLAFNQGTGFSGDPTGLTAVGLTPGQKTLATALIIGGVTAGIATAVVVNSDNDDGGSSFVATTD
jgi:hypothetical protein